MRSDESADKIGVQASERFYRKGLDLIVDKRTADLSEATEDTFDNHLITFVDFHLSKAHNFERAGLILKQKSIGGLSLTISRQLDIHDLSCDDDILMIVLLRMCQELCDFNDARQRQAELAMPIDPVVNGLADKERRKTTAEGDEYLWDRRWSSHHWE